MPSPMGHLYHESHEWLAINLDEIRVIRPFVTVCGESNAVL